MSSFILHFRPWILALLGLTFVEVTVIAVANPSPYDRTNLLEFAFAKDETPQRLFMFHKIKTFADSEHPIVQSGDSSGFYGIEPKVVMRHLPNDMTYLNMSCCANLGFSGYYNVFKLMAARNPAMEYFVLHITPYTMPRPEMWDGDGAALWGSADVTVFGDAIYREYLSPARFLHLPTMAFRREVTDFVYYINGFFNDPHRPLLRNENYLEFLKLYEDTLGWMPESDHRVYVPPTECDVPTPTFFSIEDLSYKTYLEDVFESFAELARERSVQLVIVFQPVACVYGTGAGSADARQAIERFQNAYPEVEIPFPLIETWPSEMFSDAAHVKKEHTDLIGDRLGVMMADIIDRNRVQ